MDVKKQLSALIDGEADDREAKTVFDTLKHSPELRLEAEEFFLIGEALRAGQQGELVSFPLTGRIMAALAEEPVVLAPRRTVQRQWLRPAMAVAASVAGVMVVGALVFLPQGERGSAWQFARADKASLVRVESKGVAANMQEYLIAHQAHGSGTYLGSSPQQIRTVSLVDNGSDR